MSLCQKLFRGWPESVLVKTDAKTEEFATNYTNEHEDNDWFVKIGVDSWLEFVLRVSPIGLYEVND